jgi:hypothetical protein
MKKNMKNVFFNIQRAKNTIVVWKVHISSFEEGSGAQTIH